MTFYGRDPEPKTPPRMKKFRYRRGSDGRQRTVEAEDVYFYESGHVGFWKNAGDGGRTLILAVKALDVWEEEA